MGSGDLSSMPSFVIFELFQSCEPIGELLCLVADPLQDYHRGAARAARSCLCLSTAST